MDKNIKIKYKNLAMFSFIFSPPPPFYGEGKPSKITSDLNFEFQFLTENFPEKKGWMAPTPSCLELGGHGTADTRPLFACHHILQYLYHFSIFLMNV
jgi:hypothetical protein